MYQLRLTAGLSLFAFLLVIPRLLDTISHPYHDAHALTLFSRCQALSQKIGPTHHFHERSRSDRFSLGTKPVLVKGSKIWTGGKNGTEIVHGDILLDEGLIKRVGRISNSSLSTYGSNLVVIDAQGAYLTPGLVDIHSHLGVSSSPDLEGSSDTNSYKGTIQPWLRTIDALNTHDDAYPLSIAGGVSSSLILPGSANAIGGQAFVIKLRETEDRAPSSMLLEPPHQINSPFIAPNLLPRWRHIKHACGENPDSSYNNTRMDTAWAFRKAYDYARHIKQRQDEYCSAVIARKYKGLGGFPEELQWEALVDVLRGRVKVHAHCYESVDIDSFIQLSNEFKFPIAAFHHASEAYLVPDLLNKAYGKPPAVALFSTLSGYKREAYRSSEFAPRILAEHGFTVLMKSDHPALSSRHLMYEAQKAYYYGLPENLALMSVTSNSAEVMGMGHRIGYVKEGWDADIVLWDSHPLALGATPTQVFIDGIPQLNSSRTAQKPGSFQKTPRVPNFDKGAREAVEYDGLPPLQPKKTSFDTVVFTNVKAVFRLNSGDVKQVFHTQGKSTFGTVVVHHGSVTCIGANSECLTASILGNNNKTILDLEGGSISPGFVSSGSFLGLQHIDQEPSTGDGLIQDPLTDSVPKILGGDASVIRAVDGLVFGSRDALLAYRAGVTSAITGPKYEGFYGGLGTYFSLGASHKLERGSIIQELTGMHVSINHGGPPSISTKMGALRRLFLGPQDGVVGQWFKKVKQGEIPLIVEAHSADIIATLIILKKEVEAETMTPMKMTITRATEAHLLAKELGEAGVGVILTPSRPFPYTWEDRRILPGPPITKDSAIYRLMSHNVTVGIGTEDIWAARNLPFDVAWAAIEAGGKISREEALAIGSTNVVHLLGGQPNADESLVATRSGDFLEMSSKVVAIISPSQEAVHLF